MIKKIDLKKPSDVVGKDAAERNSAWSVSYIT